VATTRLCNSRLQNYGALNSVKSFWNTLYKCFKTVGGLTTEGHQEQSCLKACHNFCGPPRQQCWVTPFITRRIQTVERPTHLTSKYSWKKRQAVDASTLLSTCLCFFRHVQRNWTSRRRGDSVDTVWCWPGLYYWCTPNTPKSNQRFQKISFLNDHESYNSS